MRLLLIAYEFPPSASPQSLRWTYLSRELALLGHEIHVLTIALGGHTPGLPTLPAGVHVHRTFAGPVRGLVAMLRERRQRALESSGSSVAAEFRLPETRSARNWKQGASEKLQAAASLLLYPDVRGEWYPWGRRALRRLLSRTTFDAVISSHEPATSLQLGLLCKGLGLPWLADLGDPVLAAYTPVRWRKKALALERRVCDAADHVTVTNPAAALLLEQRHGATGRISVITQGHDHCSSAPAGMARVVTFEPDRLELLYTGSFYRFRRPDTLLRALLQTPGARLSIAAVTVPPALVQLASEHPNQIRLLGFMPHLEALALQREADILINIGNEDPAQIPGKVYEYLGSGRPILHLSNHDHDAIEQLLLDTGCGISCANHDGTIAMHLSNLAAAKRAGRLSEHYCSDPAHIASHAWANLALQLEAKLDALTAVRSADAS